MTSYWIVCVSTFGGGWKRTAFAEDRAEALRYAADMKSSGRRVFIWDMCLPVKTAK